MDINAWVPAKFSLKQGSTAVFIGVDTTLHIPKELEDRVAALKANEAVVLRYRYRTKTLRAIRKVCSYELSFVCLLPKIEGRFGRRAEFIAKNGNAWILNVPKGMLSRIENFEAARKVRLDIIIDSPDVLTGEILNLHDR